MRRLILGVLLLLLLGIFLYFGVVRGDPDGDGLPTEVEWRLGTSPRDPDSDGDGLSDGDEVDLGCDPLDSDSDEDGLMDGVEVELGTGPLVSDSDGDGLLDGFEVSESHTNPLEVDSDGDRLGDGEEIEVYETDPLSGDSDGDGLEDGWEVEVYHTDPLKGDSDGDGLDDGVEVEELETDPLRANPNVVMALELGVEALEFVRPLDGDGVQQPMEAEFLELLSSYGHLLSLDVFRDRCLLVVGDGVVEAGELEGVRRLASLVDRLYRVLLNESGVSDLWGDLEASVELALDFGFDAVNVSDASVYALAMYVVAVEEFGFPSDLDALRLLLRGTEVEGFGRDLVDFRPIVFHSVDGNDVVLTPSGPREVWMTAVMLRRIGDDLGIELVDMPEAFLGFSQRIYACDWSLFDAKYGIHYYEAEGGRMLRPWDEDVLNLIELQFNLTWRARMGPYYNLDFPWWNSTRLRELYPEDNTLRQALLFLFTLPSSTFDMENQRRVSGIEAAKISLKQSWKEYQKICKLYPDGTLTHDIWGNVNVSWYYYDWVTDRCTPLSHPPRLVETGKQYVGMYVDQLWKIITEHPLDFWNYLKDYNGLDQYLTLNWPYWDLVKFIAGYERWNPNVFEMEGINFIIPQTLRMFGFPTEFIGINPTPNGAAYYEWAISLPRYILNRMNSNSNEKILIGPGNIFGLYSSGSGLIKDGIKDVWSFHVYLMKRD